MNDPEHLPNTTAGGEKTEEVSIFCPVRLYLGRKRFDGLLDTLDSRGGTFYVLTDEEPAHLGTEQRLTLQRERKGELILSTGQKELRIPCRVRGIRFDEDGLYMYVGLHFMLESDEDKRKLENLISSLW